MKQLLFFVAAVFVLGCATTSQGTNVGAIPGEPIIASAGAGFSQSPVEARRVHVAHVATVASPDTSMHVRMAEQARGFQRKQTRVVGLASASTSNSARKALSGVRAFNNNTGRMPDITGKAMNMFARAPGFGTNSHSSNNSTDVGGYNGTMVPDFGLDQGNHNSKRRASPPKRNPIASKTEGVTGNNPFNSYHGRIAPTRSINRNQQSNHCPLGNCKNKAPAMLRSPLNKVGNPAPF